MALVVSLVGYQLLEQQTLFFVDAEEVQEYSDEVTNVATRFEAGKKIVTEYHDNARIPFITVYEYPLDESGAAVVPPPQNVGGTNYYRVTSTDTAEDSGDEVCALATGTACTGYVDESVTGFNACTAYNPTAATVTDVNGDLSVTYCDGAPQTGPCASLTNTCLACPDCTNGVSCGESISNLYREMYVTCAAPANDVALNGGTTTLSTSTDLSSQNVTFGASQGALDWIVDGNSFLTANIPFDSGANPTDFSGTATGITFIDAPTLTTSGCQIGVCYEFDGINDQIDLNQPLSSFMSDTSGSISVWVRPTGSAPNVIYAYSGDQIISSRFEVGLSQAIIGGQNRLWAFNYDSAEDRIGTSYTTNEWTHLVWVHGGGHLRLYQDGVLVGEKESGNTSLLSQEVRIGGAVSYGARFQGFIDEVQLYDIALSPDQVLQIYQDTSAGFAGPRVIQSEHTGVGEVWNLEAIPIAGGGGIGGTNTSGNTVTISEDPISVSLNSGTTTLDTYTTLESSVTGIVDGGAAYVWEKNSIPLMQLNYPMNNGGTAFDLSGNSRDGVINGAGFSPNWQDECKIGGCLYFDGVNDYIDTNLPLSAFMSDYQGSISVWAKPTGSAPNVTYAYSGDQIISSRFEVGLSQASIGGQNRLWAFHYDSNEDRVGVDYVTDEWVHLAWVYGGGRLRLYKDGVFAGSVETGNTSLLSQEVRIGNASSYGAHFQGFIDEVQVYDFALSEEQVGNLFNAGDAEMPGPQDISQFELNASDVFDLDITPLDINGIILSDTSSSNTVTIDEPTVNTTLNLGGATLSTFSDLSSVTTGLTQITAAYNWTENTSPYMQVNIPFNAGDTIFDYSGNSRNGVRNGAAFSPREQGLCQVGGCMFFDGVNDYIDTNQPLSSFMSNTEGSISVWARPTGSAPNVTYAYSGDQIISSRFEVGISQARISGIDQLWAFHYDSNEDRVGTPYTVDEWVHLTWVHGGGQLLFYKNGSFVGSTASGNTSLTTQEVRIGNASSYGQHFQGYIDEVQMWDFALTAAQIEQLYDDNAAGISGPTVIASPETVGSDEWELSVTPMEENSADLSIVNAGTTVTITVPPTSLNLNGGNLFLSTTEDLVPASSGIGDPQAGLTWQENGAPYLTSNYPFNLGGTQFDYSGNAYDADVIQAAFSPQGQSFCQVGGCMFFDGVNDYIDTNQPLSSFITDTEGTVSVWARPTGVAPNVTYAYSGDQIFSSRFEVGLSQANIGGTDRLWAFNYDTNEDRVGAPYTSNEWTHLVWVHSGGVLRLYKDGEFVDSTLSGNTSLLTQEVRFGGAVSYGQPFQGYIDEVQTWDFGLTVSQIEQLYDDGAARVAGPSQITSSETIVADVWNLDITAFKGDGSPLSTTASTNTVTVQAPSVVVQLNNGSNIIDPAVDLTSQVTGLGPAAAAYEWELNSAPWMSLNIPYNPGNTQIDYSGNNYDVTTNGPAYSIEAEGNCQVGGCHFYDGVNDFDDVNQPLSALMSETTGSISVWVRPTGSAPNVTYAYSGDQIISSRFEVGLSQANIGGQDRLWAFNYDTNEDRVGVAYTPNEWTHLIWVHDAGQLSLYKDGTLVNSVASGNTSLLTQEVRIGNAVSYGQHFQGYIDEVQVYPFALSTDQIDILYTNGVAGVAGPINIADEHVNLNDTWNLTVTPFESDGTPFAPNNSGNTTTGFINTPPNTPVRRYPADGLTTVELSPELSVNYTDINAGHIGTTEYRVSTGSQADCINNVNVVDTGTSATTATINEDTVYIIGVVLADFTTYTWCARNYDTFDYSNGGAFTGMGEFTVDTTYSEGGKIRQIQQTQTETPSDPDPSPDESTQEQDDSSNEPEEGADTENDEDTSEEDDSGSNDNLPQDDPTSTDDTGLEPDSGADSDESTEENTPVQDSEIPQQEQDEAPGDGELPPPQQPPTQQESSNIEQIIQQIQQDAVNDNGEPIEFTERTLSPTSDGSNSSENRTQTNAQSDGRSFTIEVDDTSSDETEDTIEQDESPSELIVTGLASTEEDRIEFNGTTSQPGTTVTLIFNNNVTVVVTSDEAGLWQTFVSADQLGVQSGETANVSVEAIAAKGELMSDKVVVGQIELALMTRVGGDGEELIAEFRSIVEENSIVTNIQAVQEQVIEVIQEQEEVIQQTLTITAPVVVVSSAPLWGYLPYLPTIVYHFITYLIGLIGRRKQEKDHVFGQVYDAITKKPLGLVVIRIYAVGENNESGRLIATKVSDKLGRYDLLLEPGKYRIEAKKPQYTYPSKIETFNPVVVLDSDMKSDTPDIPLDPIDGKRRFELANIFKKSWLILQHVGHYLAVPILLVGSISSALTVVAVPGSIENWILALVYLFLFILQLRLRPVIEKAWGVVYDLATSAPLPLTTIQLIDPEYGKVVTSRLTDYEGRFAFLPEPGNYLVKATKQGYEQAEIVDNPTKKFNPISGKVSVQKEGQRIDGDIAMKQL